MISFQVVLETEITNRPALRLYENLGFVRDKRLFRYYLNGVDALREDDERERNIFLLLGRLDWWINFIPKISDMSWILI